MVNTVRFTNKVPKNKEKNSAYFLLISSILFISTFNYFFYINSSFLNPTGFPNLNIYFSGNLDGKKFSKCEIEYDDLIISSEIKYRGSTSLNYDKKDYRICLSQKESFLGMRRDDDWQLFGSYLDFTRMRVKFSMDLWRSLQFTNPTAILPKTENVIIYKNDKFEGLYLLGEVIDRKLFNLDKTIKGIKSSLIFQAKGESKFEDYDEDSWEQDWPNKNKINIIDSLLPELIDFVKWANDNEFFNSETGIFSKFDKLNLIDYYVYNFFIDHKDSWQKNYFIVRQEYPSKFYFVPWDFEGSLGQWGWIKYDSDENQEEEIKESHYLWNRLLNNIEFRTECNNRWNELREKLWTEEYMLEMVFNEYEKIEELINKDTVKWKPITVDKKPQQKWPYMYKYSTKEFNLDEYISYLIDWIPERLRFCDDYFCR